MGYKHAGILSQSDLDDLAWDDEAEANSRSRFDHIPTPAGKKSCRCGSKDTKLVGGEPFCDACYDKIVECCECGHHGTIGDFTFLFDDECCEVCPACGNHDTTRQPIWKDKA